MIKGTITPHGYPQHFHSTVGADIHFTTPREFTVDPQATRVLDEKGKPLVLPPHVYEELRKKNGGPIVIEPLGGADGALEKQAALEQQLAAGERELVSARARIADLEQQLAAAQKPAPAKPAAKPEKV